MANTVNTTTLVDGARNVVQRVDIAGDGSGDEATTKIVDFSTFTRNNAGGRDTYNYVKIDKAKSSLSGFSARLLFDADSNDPALDLGEGSEDLDFCEYGGIPNPQSTGYTGDILLTTVGLGANDKGTIILELRKHT